MNSTTFVSRAIKRVLRDLEEIQKDPIPGLALCMPDKNDPFTLHGNIEVRDGIYEGILLHLVIHIPEEYPIKPPAVNIAPGLDFGNEYHSHIYDNLPHGNSICTDLTSNFAGHFSVIDAHGKPTRSGWTPAYTLSSVLMQLQIFFADPDMPKESYPSAEKIQKLKDHISQYQLDIRTNDEENGVQIVTHSFEKPYPSLSNITIETVSEEKDLKTVSVKKEETNVSRSTAYSANRNQSNNSSNDNQSSSSASSERRHELLEELKEEEEVKEIVSSKKATTATFGWDKPLKKVSKEDAEKSTTISKTVIVTVQTIIPEEPEIEWPLKVEEKKSRRSDRVANKKAKKSNQNRNQEQGSNDSNEVKNSNNQRNFRRENNNNQSKPSSSKISSRPSAEIITIPEVEETKVSEPEEPESQQNAAWGKPLKKISKDDAAKNSVNSQTVVITVSKILPKEPEIEVWPLKSDEKSKRAPKVKNERNSRNGNYNRDMRDTTGRQQNNQRNTRRNNDNNQARNSASTTNNNAPVIIIANSQVEEEKVPETQQTNTAWGNSLAKRSAKPNQPRASNSTTTAVVSVSKGNNSQVTTTRRQANVPYASATSIKSIDIGKDTFFTKEDIYKETITKNETSSHQIKREISSKLVCSVTKTDVFDSSKPILGYPIDLEKDVYGRLWPTPIMEILSYDAYVFNIQQNFEKLDNYHRVKFTSSFGSQYNYWLPVYVDEAHFERSQQYIFNAIAIIYAGVEGKKENDFHPLMVLKVLPPILVKTAVHFLKGTIHQSVVGVDSYCQLYRLFVKLVEIFPELQEAIDKEVKNFCKSDANRHKKVAGDLGEFMIKLSLSSEGLSNPEVMNCVMKEHMARQVSWALRKDRGLRYKDCQNFLERFMEATQVSNQFFLTKLEIARLLLDEDMKVELEKRCGLLSDKTMQLFRARLNWIQKNINGDWSVVVAALQQESFIYSDQVMLSYVTKAFDAARIKGYLDY